MDRDATVTIATSKAQVSSIHNQLGDAVGVCVEPCRRDTFPAIALATAYLHDVKGVGLEEPVVVCPVDPYVNNDYFEALKKLSDLAAQGNANLSLMGIEPTYPSEKYGYIIPETADSVSKVKTFKEKPDARLLLPILPKGPSGTEASLPISCSMYGTVLTNCWTSRTIRIFLPSMKRCRRSALTMQWWRRNPTFR